MKSSSQFCSTILTLLVFGMCLSPALAGTIRSIPGAVAKRDNVPAAAALIDAGLVVKGAARVDDYDLVLINIPGAVNSQGFEINNRRIVAGGYSDIGGAFRSFVWFNGQVITISKPDEYITAVFSINDNGLLFGNWGNQTVQHAGYYDLEQATWTTLPDIEGYALNIGYRMNNAGQAVGAACQGTFDAPVACEGWSWNGKGYTIYQYPGALQTIPEGVNDKGEEVGYWQKTSTIYWGYKRELGQFTTLTLKAENGVYHPIPYDVNNDGSILGAAPLDPNDYWPSIIFDKDGEYRRLPKYPGLLRTFYQGMNERQDVTGLWFNDLNGGYFALVGFHRRHDENDSGDGQRQ